MDQCNDAFSTFLDLDENDYHNVCKEAWKDKYLSLCSEYAGMVLKCVEHHVGV